jgi:low affinity Fe/Cu permease
VHKSVLSPDPNEEEKMNDAFRKLAGYISRVAGSPFAFVAALLLILVWLVSGPIFNFSDTWQLVINTGTTIITFLMVFLIQNTQNRETKAMNLKLDELIRVMKKARNDLVDLENASDEELNTFQEQFQQLREKVTNVENKTEDMEELEEIHEKVDDLHEKVSRVDKKTDGIKGAK